MKPTFEYHIFKEKKSTFYQKQRTDSKSDLETNRNDFMPKLINSSPTAAFQLQSPQTLIGHASAQVLSIPSGRPQLLPGLGDLWLSKLSTAEGGSMKHRHRDGDLALRPRLLVLTMCRASCTGTGDKTRYVPSTRGHQGGGGRGRRAFQMGFPWKAPKRGWNLQMAETWRWREKEYPDSS